MPKTNQAATIFKKSSALSPWTTFLSLVLDDRNCHVSFRTCSLIFKFNAIVERVIAGKLCLMRKACAFIWLESSWAFSCVPVSWKKSGKKVAHARSRLLFAIRWICLFERQVHISDLKNKHQRHVIIFWDYNKHVYNRLGTDVRPTTFSAMLEKPNAQQTFRWQLFLVNIAWVARIRLMTTSGKCCFHCLLKLHLNYDRHFPFCLNILTQWCMQWRTP